MPFTETGVKYPEAANAGRRKRDRRVDATTVIQ
jgi:hypothetical protein